MSKATPAVNLKSMFLGLQQEMRAAMSVTQQHVGHPTAKGNATELRWASMLEHYLPKRYAVATAFVLDSTGSLSQQQDLVVYDRQYTPFLLNHDDAVYIPAEGVYGIFEVKQTLEKDTVAYAGEKAASVRTLLRTSAPITHAGGTFTPRSPIPILAGLLCTDSRWQQPESHLPAVLGKVAAEERLDLLCALGTGTYECTYEKGVSVTTAPADAALITFFLRLLARLQGIGTVPAMDYSAYTGTLA